MKKVLSILLTGMMALSLVACGSSEDTGKTYTFSSELDIKNLDSSDADDGMSFNAMHACIDGLMGLDEDGQISEAIAKSYEVSEDGLTHTFKLRDAKWSNGEAVTANDFVYAWRRIIQKSGNYAYMLGSDGAAIAGADELMAKQADGAKLTKKDMKTLGVVAEDDKTLVVTTTRRVQYFAELMTFPCYYPINEKFCEEAGAQYAKAADKVLSNGAFVMDSWEVGRQATFKKNEDYWNADAVKIDTLVMNLVQTPEVAATAFDNGETDFALINSDLVDKYIKEDSFKQITEGYLFYLSINFENSDLANVNIRKALSLAINRDDFTANTLKDGSTTAKGFVPTGLAKGTDGSDFRDSAATYTAYDTAAAQEAFNQGLAELGKTSLTIRLLYGTDESPMDLMATYLQNAFSKIEGLNIEMVATTKQDRIYNKQANGDYDVACTRWGPDYSDPTTYLNLLLKDNSNNYGHYNNPAYDAKMDEVIAATDDSVRWAAMIDAEKIAMDDYAYIPIFEKGSASLQNPKVSGLVLRPVGVPYTFNYVDIK
ncbi:MAG: peptide ABC transporter substrate-binding protein [Erysipelotrichia bacterium]|nr:peptide ABC transporter substrate-binding protein [Erysipelotrichia bacterium]